MEKRKRKSFSFLFLLFLFYIILFYFTFFFRTSISDTLKIVRDGKYGAKNPKEIGGWDGMVGELVRRVSLNIYVFFDGQILH